LFKNNVAKPFGREVTLLRYKVVILSQSLNVSVPVVSTILKSIVVNPLH